MMFCEVCEKPKNQSGMEGNRTKISFSAFVPMGKEMEWLRPLPSQSWNGSFSDFYQLWKKNNIDVFL